MKKLVFGICMLCISIAAQAQFEQGKWIVNPSITGLDLSYSSEEKTEFGINAQVGAFVADNVALLVTFGGEWTNGKDAYGAGAGGRYYFNTTGIYIGAGLKMNNWKYKHEKSVTDYAAFAEVGYAFFITKTITIEPAAYCNLSLKDSDYSKYGLKVGFGLYF